MAIEGREGKNHKGKEKNNLEGREWQLKEGKERISKVLKGKEIKDPSDSKEYKE